MKKRKAKPRNPQLRLLLGNEVIADNFAGGGGASTGIHWATGRHPDIAINHDAEAIAMHAANHPSTKHYVTNIWDVDPIEATGGRPVALAWFSPDCRHHSKSKGGKPRDTKIRGLAWTAVRWAAAVKPRVIALENVEEFADWGPLIKVHVPRCPGERKGKKCAKTCQFNKPCPLRKGKTFRAFVNKLRRHGYHVEHRMLRACDYGAPTTRRRLFLIARRDSVAITWPEPTHGPGRAKPHRTAAEIIDWTIPVPSIFDRAKPHVDATCRRVARGVRKFVLGTAKPFLMPYYGERREGEKSRASSLDEPVKTLSTANRMALCAPYMVKLRGTSDAHIEASAKPMAQPIDVVSAGGEYHALVVPYLVHRSNGERPGQAPRIYDAQEPLRTVVSQGQKQALCLAFLAKHYGGHEGSGAGLDGPIHTVTTVDHHALVTAEAATATELTPAMIERGRQVAAFLVRYNGTGDAEPLDRPLGVLTTRDRYGLVTVELAGDTYAIVDICMRMLSPAELFAAQGFPPDYQVAPVGPSGKPLTRTAQVRMCGNSVCPPMAAAIVRSQQIGAAA